MFYVELMRLMNKIEIKRETLDLQAIYYMNKKISHHMNRNVKRAVYANTDSIV